MLVLVKEVGKGVYKQQIDGSLESLQNLVQGGIELVPRGEKLRNMNIAILCNEEGRLIGLDENLIILGRDGRELTSIVGNIVYVGLDAQGDFIGLTEEQVALINNEIFDNPVKGVRIDGLVLDSLML